MKLRDTSKIDTIFIHHSQSKYGNAEEIDRWHKDRGWTMIGYNDVILNCYPTYESWAKNKPDINSDGVCEDGRPIEYIPAGARGHNTNSIHICMIGDDVFSSAQIERLQEVVKFYKSKYPTIRQVLRHCDVDPKKPHCPSISNQTLRELLA